MFEQLFNNIERRNNVPRTRF